MEFLSGGDDDGAFGATVDDVGAGRVGHEGGKIADLRTAVQTNIAADTADAEQTDGERVLGEGFDGSYFGAGDDDFADAFVEDDLLVIDRYSSWHERRHTNEKRHDDTQNDQEGGLVRSVQILCGKINDGNDHDGAYEDEKAEPGHVRQAF